MGDNTCWKALTLTNTVGALSVSLVSFPANHSAKQCRTPCALRAACGECTSGSSECMWCSNMKQCVDSNAYVASFPFGQCMEWYTMSSCPRKWKASSRHSGVSCVWATTPAVGQCPQPLNTLGTGPWPAQICPETAWWEPSHRIKHKDTSS